MISIYVDFILTHPIGFVLHFALMQNEAKDQDRACLPTRFALES